MGETKASLEEMAVACDEQAQHVSGILAHYKKEFPELPPQTTREREAFVFESAAQLLRVLGTFPDESRAFVVGLLKKHAGTK